MSVKHARKTFVEPEVIFVKAGTKLFHKSKSRKPLVLSPATKKVLFELQHSWSDFNKLMLKIKLDLKKLRKLKC